MCRGSASLRAASPFPRLTCTAASSRQTRTSRFDEGSPPREGADKDVAIFVRVVVVRGDAKVRVAHRADDVLLCERGYEPGGVIRIDTDERPALERVIGGHDPRPELAETG